ncbi:hypothetical protein BJ085DRAFT_32169 [Dimargaris cristalligena]|uniref:Uncharacterized protein n=1 Tax=Dimargaris cristalligena TaxID=215637 RepID=A0A4P9ZLI3_9FUNG|nr:hypothetical protein BJ085DRAFT_32169 [Dimargaris cristalligena]|eukprot:RKP33985.1 hypothetical protein BJ085DRAFT_32169 [Dimargaris cristalligena]
MFGQPPSTSIHPSVPLSKFLARFAPSPSRLDKLYTRSKKVARRVFLSPDHEQHFKTQAKGILHHGRNFAHATQHQLTTLSHALYAVTPVWEGMKPWSSTTTTNKMQMIVGGCSSVLTKLPIVCTTVTLLGSTVGLAPLVVTLSTLAGAVAFGVMAVAVSTVLVTLLLVPVSLAVACFALYTRAAVKALPPTVPEQVTAWKADIVTSTVRYTTKVQDHWKAKTTSKSAGNWLSQCVPAVFKAKPKKE